MTTGTTPDTGIVGRVHDAFNRGDLDAVAAELAEDVVLHRPGENGLPGPLEGRDQVVGQFQAQLRLHARAGSTIRLETRNAHQLAGLVVAVSRAVVTIDGKDHIFELIDVCRLRDGKLAEIWSMTDDEAAVRRILDALRARLPDA